jgi:hypothetical protein
MLLRVVAALLLTTLTAACQPASPAATSTSPPGVVFELLIGNALFEPGGTLTVTVWDEEQWALKAQVTPCVVVSIVEQPAGGEWTVEPQVTETCPPDSVVPQPETFTLTANSLVQTVQISSTLITPGEAYRIEIFGPSSDLCNSTTMFFQGEAASILVAAEPEEIRTTLALCVTAIPSAP